MERIVFLNSPITASDLLQALLISLLLTLLLSWLSIRLACRIRLIDYPSSAPHKKHLNPTPLAGGIALLGTLLVGESALGTITSPNILATFTGALTIFAFGIWDDYKILRPMIKLIGQVLAALVLIAMGVHIRIFESPEFFLRGGEPFNLLMDWGLTILWIVGVTNAFNFVDSMDGLAVGLGGTAAAFFMLVTLDAGQPVLSLHSAMIIGACIGLYFFNSPPALLFLGDSGAQTMGFILAVLAIVYVPVNANQSSSWVVPIMLLGVPIFDSALVVVSRLRRGVPVYEGSQDHTYHRLLSLGFGPLRSVFAMHGTSLILGCLAFIILPQPPLVANLIFLLVLLCGVAGIVFLDRKKYWVERYHLGHET